jgi:hypothetical protein
VSEVRTLPGAPSSERCSTIKQGNALPYVLQTISIRRMAAPPSKARNRSLGHIRAPRAARRRCGGARLVLLSGLAEVFEVGAVSEGGPASVGRAG